ncbi:MAG: putative glycosyltransferase [Variovorax sp.]|nr:putative glycosyltransferase [Variovorax sp.]
MQLNDSAIRNAEPGKKTRERTDGNGFDPSPAGAQRGASNASSAWMRTCLAGAAVFLWLAATAWFRPLTAPDEGRYVGVAFEMLRSGNWLVPRLDGLPFFHKPPLFYWMSATAMALLGPSEWSARLPSILGATLTAMGLLLFLRRWAGARIAWLSVVVLLTMPYFYVAAQFANLDMLVASCIAATVLSAVHATLSREQGAAWRGALAGAFLFAALGILAKGLIGLVLPGLIFLAWCAGTRRFGSAWLLAWLPGWGLFLAVAAPWLVAMQLRYPAFFDYFVVTQHFRRFAASGFNNEHAFWFYLPVIAGLTLPWFGWLAFAGWRRRQAWTGRVPGPRLSDVDWLMVIWCVAIVVFFSLPRSKLIGYVLPALPPLAYLTARVVTAVVARTGRAPAALRWTAGSAALICVSAIVLVGLLGVPPGARLRLPAGETIGPDDQVVMLDTYFYEIPFYWKLRRPVMVSGDWSPASMAESDDWRNELFDAGQFDPAQGRKLLISSNALPATLCVPRVTWLVGPSNSQLAHPWLAGVRLIAYNQQAAVWRFAGSPAPGAKCLEAPGAGSSKAAASS